jgi:putative ABC transport system permease protein
MLVFTTLVASLTCIAFGLTPAFQSTRADAAEAVKTNSRILSTSRKQLGLRQLLVIAQVSLSLVLLVSALLFSGSLRNLLAVDPGFQQNGILIANLDFSRLHIPTGQRMAFRRSLVERIRAVPGVVSAGEVSMLPLSGSGINNSVWRDGVATGSKSPSNFNWFGPGYLRTMGITLLAGRDFDDHDTTSSPKVAIVNQSFARKFGLGHNPIGQRFRREATPSDPETSFEIVGLVKDTKYYTLREEFTPIGFLSITQNADSDPFEQIVVRSSTSLAATTSEVRTVVEQVNPSIDLDFKGFENAIRSGLMRERLMATLSSFFGVLAALIASVGLYGVMSYLVARRTKEIGVRIALGADRRSIVALILREAGGLLAVGILIGSLLAVAATGAAKGMLFGMKPYDPATLVFAAMLLASVTLLASYLPARRAARQEPMTALRIE